MKTLLLFFGFASCLGLVLGDCMLQKVQVDSRWTKMDSRCLTKMKSHVQEEINASMTYLALGTYFAQSHVNLLGFSEFFFKAAKEEREHAIKFIEYLLMRGYEMDKKLINVEKSLQFLSSVLPEKTQEWSSTMALDAALKLETSVTNKIRDVIIVCEEPSKVNNGPAGDNDYHLVDHLITEFLDEQYKGQRDIAGKISTLKKMVVANGGGKLAEFIFDKKLLKGEI